MSMNVIYLWFTFGPKKDEVIGGWKNLNNVELHNLYCSKSIIRMIKSRKMRWAGHVARMGETRNAYRKERDRRWEDNIKNGS
jgi:hypothetical protein